MKYLSYITNLFKALEPAESEEIALHIQRLNALLQAYQQVRTMTEAEWQATEREIEIELQWFDIHRLKLTSTSYPILPTDVCLADTNSLKNQLTHTARRDEQIEKKTGLKLGFRQ